MDDYKTRMDAFFKAEHAKRAIIVARLRRVRELSKDNVSYSPSN
jgi:hypothetical protein